MEESSYRAPGPEVGHNEHAIDINQDDAFDFEIGGGDEYAATGEVDPPNNDLTQQTNDTETPDGPYTYETQDDVEEPLTVESYNEESLGYANDEIDLGVSGFDAFAEGEESAGDAQDGETVEHGENEDQNDDGSHDEIYYEETAGELDDLVEAAPPEPAQGSDYLNASTSVDSLHDRDGLQDFTEEVERTETQLEAQATETTAAPGTPNPEMIPNNDETAGGHGDSDNFQDASIGGDGENDDIDPDAADTTTAEGHPSTESVDEPMNQSNWDAEDYDEDKDHRPNAFLNVTVSYQGQEYFLFAESPDEDPNTYFLDDVDLIHQSLSQFLSSVRDVISSEVVPSQEIFLQVDGLGLEFGESTTAVFLDETTFAQIIEVNKRLVQHDGGSQSPELYIYLSVRSHPLRRLEDLVKGADAGQGLSDFEKYYEDASADASAADEEEQLGPSQDVISDDLSLDDTNDDGEEMKSGSVASHDAQETSNNSFRVDGKQYQSIAETSVSGTEGIQTAEREENAASPAEVSAFGPGTNGSADSALEGDHNDVALDAADVHEAFVDDSTGAVVSFSGRSEAEIVYLAHDNEVEDEHGPTDDGGIIRTEDQAEVPIDVSQEGQERTDGENLISLPGSTSCGGPDLCLCDDCYSPGSPQDDHDGVTKACATSSVLVPFSDEEWELLMSDFQGDDTKANSIKQDATASAAEDENYLDLGDDGDLPQATAYTDVTQGDIAITRDTLRQASDNSSATATLDGEHSAHGDDTVAGQAPADSVQHPGQVESDTFQNDVDEIDWNHDEDDEIGVAHQNPTTLSPSSPPSAKRSRQEEQDTGGPGDDHGMY